jgi:hypothetical protein
MHPTENPADGPCQAIDIDVADVGYLCSECHEPSNLDNRRTGCASDDGCELLCEDCFDDSHVTCEECEDTVHEDHSHAVINRRGHEVAVCESCHDRHYITCADCGNGCHNVIVTNIAQHSGWHTHYVCESCLEDYSCCENCNSYVSGDHYAGNGLCDDCYSDNRDDGPIRDYSDRATDYLIPFGNPRDGMLLGVELEVEVRSDWERGERAEHVLDTIGEDFVICKEDGSLNHGFEIVTAPADLPTQRERWTRLLQTTPRGMKSWNTQTCGMHVHVSRAALTPLSLGKLLVFVAQEQKFVEELAGRSSAQWAAISPKKLTDGGTVEREDGSPIIDANGNMTGHWVRGRRTGIAQKRGGLRYEAVNLCNYNTIEFRIFKGSLKLQTVLKNIEFATALVAYTRQCGLNDLTRRKFCQWIGKAPKAYPALSAWLRDRGYLPAPKPRPVPLVMAQADV